MSAILVVEDEAPIRAGLCDVLAFRGHAPVGVADGEEGLRQGAAARFDLAIVDVMLPRMDGFAVVRGLRAARPSLPILMLTARAAESDVLEGFAAGADDYVTKPFSLAQLLARVDALLRRSGLGGRERFAVGGVAVDAATLRVEGDVGAADLTARDVEILAFLATRAGAVVSREDLLRQVWRFERLDRVETRCVDMHMVKLRRKLAAVTDAEVVETVRGAGYRVSA